MRRLLLPFCLLKIVVLPLSFHRELQVIHPALGVTLAQAFLSFL